MWVGDIGAGGVVGGRAVRCSASGVERISAMEKVRRHRGEMDKNDPRWAVGVDTMNSLERACSGVFIIFATRIAKRKLPIIIFLILIRVRKLRSGTQKWSSGAAGVSR